MQYSTVVVYRREECLARMKMPMNEEQHVPMEMKMSCETRSMAGAPTVRNPYTAGYIDFGFQQPLSLSRMVSHVRTGDSCLPVLARRNRKKKTRLLVKFMCQEQRGLKFGASGCANGAKLNINLMQRFGFWKSVILLDRSIGPVQPVHTEPAQAENRRRVPPVA
ncbi:hypothetical protein IEQ34_013211 [Dendrobium chrysotoxum]|uniref:Uncharacterized protein n=1 Tax=Dendrobium chrysotoxum TaxID=161865 RepID=A0AAV7GP03_DENCH|nr:hypothetical protein IEQ34_013211 [Dendrobium chrysotoxum]